MAKERLSKVQRFILIAVYKDPSSDPRNEECFGAGYRQILWTTARQTGRTHKVMTIFAGEKEYIADNFRVIFSQSLRNMEKKGLIESMYYKEVYAKHPRPYESVRKQNKIFGIFLTDAGKAKAEALIKKEPALLI